MDEDEYFSQIEKIIKRDYYPDLAKLEALQTYDKDRSSDVPSVLLKSTERSFSTKPNPQDKTKSYGAKIGLDEYLKKFTSEDNASFQEIHDEDHKRHLKKIGWMFDESKRYN